MLTRRHLEILSALMALPEGDREIVCDGSRCAVDLEFTTRRVVDGLLAHMAVKDSGYNAREGCAVYVPTENTQRIIDRPELADEMVARVYARKPFFVDQSGVIQDT